MMDDLGFDVGMKYKEEGNATIAWIMYFFNITKEDSGNR